jgi:O-antigen ligase
MVITEHPLVPPRPTAVATPAQPLGRRWSADPLVLAGGLGAGLLVVGTVFAAPDPLAGPTGLLIVALGGACAAAMLASPMTALLVLIVASFARLAVSVPGLPAEPMVLAFAALVVAAAIAGARGTLRFRFGALETAMAAYLLWNVVSAFLPHLYPAVDPRTGDPIVVYRFVLTGTVLPFVAFAVGHALIRGRTRIRALLFTVVVLAGYSALLSIMQFTGPFELVWPRYVVVAGFVTAAFLAHERTLSRFPRLAAALVAVLCVPGIYLTRTRAVWLVFGLGVLVCAIFARGRRPVFVATIATAVGFVAATWSTFTSSDRAAGGVGSVNEVDDRFNAMATSLWAIEREPLVGWGIARFAQVNTYHHQKWEQGMSFLRGYGIASHENELGIATELGLIGLALWLAVLGLLGYALGRALRRLPVDGLDGRALGLLALTVFCTWVVCGLTVDLRFFDFANLLVFLLVGSAVGNAAIADRAGTPGPLPLGVRA